MSITIREPVEGDFFNWLSLYEGYAKFYKEPLNDKGALIVWSWLTDPGNALHGLVAVDEAGELVGLAHFQTFARPLEGSQGIYLDDLFVAKSHRKSGVGRALIDAVTSIAAQGGYSVVRWVSAPDNERARALYDDVATPTEWVTYDRALNG